MNREEKEELVIQLYKESKSIREIAKIMHMSFRDISQITKKYKKQIEQQKGHVEEKLIINKNQNQRQPRPSRCFQKAKLLLTS
jgi:transposase